VLEPTGPRAVPDPKPSEKDGWITYRGEGAKAAVEEKRRRLECSAGPGERVEVRGPLVHHLKGEGSYELPIDEPVWRRFAAKLGLGFGRELLGEAWLDEPVAQHLRVALRKGTWSHPSLGLGLPDVSAWDAYKDWDPELRHVLQPPTHVITTAAGPGGDWLVVFLFCELRFEVPLGADTGASIASSAPTWAFDPRAGRARRSTWAEYVEAVRSGDPVPRSS